MAENLKVLRRRIRTVAGTKQVTRAMEMVSASKLRKAQNRLLSGRPFTQKIQEMLSHLLGAPGVGENPLFAERTAGRTLVVVITADRGLAGSFNARLLSAADEYLSQLPAGEAALYLIGKKGADYYRRHPRCEVVRAITDMGGNLSPERSAEITDELVGGFLSGRYKSVHIVFAHYVSTILSRPTRISFSAGPRVAGGGAGRARGGAARRVHLRASPRAVFDNVARLSAQPRVHDPGGELHLRAQRAHGEHEQRHAQLRGDALRPDAAPQQGRQASITKRC
ncbi:F0F1 ATP synthase subunit gamma [bacterium]|nr:F0F1 ATP synthase subunit gamma [bacterium]